MNGASRSQGLPRLPKPTQQLSSQQRQLNQKHAQTKTQVAESPTEEVSDPFDPAAQNAQTDQARSDALVDKELGLLATHREELVKEIESLEKSFKEQVLSRRLSSLPHKTFPSDTPPTSTTDPSEELVSLARDDFSRVRAAQQRSSDERRKKAAGEEDAVRRKKEGVQRFFEERRAIAERMGKGVWRGSFAATVGGNVVGVERVADEMVVAVGEKGVEIWHIPSLTTPRHPPTALSSATDSRRHSSFSSSWATTATATAPPPPIAPSRLLDILQWPAGVDPVTVARRVYVKVGEVGQAQEQGHVNGGGGGSGDGNGSESANASGTGTGPHRPQQHGASHTHTNHPHPHPAVPNITVSPPSMTQSDSRAAVAVAVPVPLGSTAAGLSAGASSSGSVVGGQAATGSTSASASTPQASNRSTWRGAGEPSVPRSHHTQRPPKHPPLSSVMHYAPGPDRSRPASTSNSSSSSGIFGGAGDEERARPVQPQQPAQTQTRHQQGSNRYERRASMVAVPGGGRRGSVVGGGGYSGEGAAAPTTGSSHDGGLSEVAVSATSPSGERLRVRLGFVVGTQTGQVCLIDIVGEEDIAGGDVVWRVDCGERKKVAGGPVLSMVVWWPGAGAQAKGDGKDKDKDVEMGAGAARDKDKTQRQLQVVIPGRAAASNGRQPATSSTTDAVSNVNSASTTTPTPGSEHPPKPCVMLVSCHGSTASLVDLAVPSLMERWRVSLTDLMYIGRSRRLKEFEVTGDAQGADWMKTHTVVGTKDGRIEVASLNSPAAMVAKDKDNLNKEIKFVSASPVPSSNPLSTPLTPEGLAAACAITAMAVDGTKGAVVLAMDDGVVLRVMRKAKKLRNVKGAKDGKGASEGGKGKVKGSVGSMASVAEESEVATGNKTSGTEDIGTNVKVMDAKETNEAITRSPENAENGNVKTEKEIDKTNDGGNDKLVNSTEHPEPDKEEVQISYLFSLVEMPIYQDPNETQPPNREQRDEMPVPHRITFAVSITPFLDSQLRQCLLVGGSDGTVRAYQVPLPPASAPATPLFRASPAVEDRRVWSGEAAGMGGQIIPISVAKGRGGSASGKEEDAEKLKLMAEADEEVDGEVFAAAVCTNGGDGAGMCVSVGSQGTLSV
ncbi:hypothetical protein HDU93_009036 [Gonapodya sp. JEL0774]|nr:hypothetical protein HDU93_009036 [Gonapodya sp. JEL0774]